MVCGAQHAAKQNKALSSEAGRGQQSTECCMPVVALLPSSVLMDCTILSNVARVTTYLTLADPVSSPPACVPSGVCAGSEAVA